MLKTIKKRGRPQASYRLTTTGERIHGLLRRADGRWKISATRQTFVEPDEMLAVARFRQWQAKHQGGNLGQLAVHATAEAAMIDIARRTNAAGGSLSATVKLAGEGTGGWAVTDHTLSPEQWAWLRHQIIERPQWVAEQVGVEQVGYIRDLKRPRTSETLKKVGDLYAAKVGLSANEASRSKLMSKEFTRAAGAERISDITHDAVVVYERVIQSGTYAPKSILHRIRKVRTILAYAIKRGTAVADCRKALDITAMLEVRDHTPLDPRQITPHQFWSIYDAAAGAGDRVFAALMLTALNGAFYSSEVAKLKWQEIDLDRGEIVARRTKTGVSRVAVLWPETVEALNNLDRPGEYVFNTRVRSYTTFSVLEAWRKYRGNSGQPEDVTFGRIRDAGFTVACRISLDQARVLAGLRLPGASDHCVRRNPQFVANACRAIHDEFTAGRNKRSG